MPISSGANRWPKSYWTKPQPPEAPQRLIKVTERPSIRRPKPRAVSLPCSVDSPSKLDNTFQLKSSSEAAWDGARSDAQLQEPAALRSPGVVMPPLSVERLTTVKHDTNDSLRSQPAVPRSPEKQPRRTLSCTASIGETTTSSTRPLKSICCPRSVSTTSFSLVLV